MAWNIGRGAGSGWERGGRARGEEGARMGRGGESRKGKRGEKG